jgi:hypothetical protein
MTNKDVFKVLLCSYGYDRSIKIETYRGDDGSIEINCEDFMFHIHMILSYMKDNAVPFKSNWWSVPLKYVCNDVSRINLTNSWDKSDSDNEKWVLLNKPIQEWHVNNNPCPTCTINKKDHWDDIHYNCELNHNHSCKIMIDHYEKLREMRKQINITE